MKILIAIDASEASLLAVPILNELTLPAGSTIELLTVIEEDAGLYGPWPAMPIIPSPAALEQSIAAARSRLEAIAAHLTTDGRTIRGVVHTGRPATEIVRAAERLGADLVIVGARGHGMVERLVIGSVSSEVVDQAHCPVLVVRSPHVDRILLATDGSPDADRAAEFVGSGIFGHPTMKVISVVDPGMPWWAGISPVDGMVAADSYVSVRDAAERQASEAARMTAERLGTDHVTAERHSLGGDVGSTIVAEAIAWQADVVAIGTRAHGVLRRALVGSTSRHVLHGAPMSVLIVRPVALAKDAARTDAA